MLNDSLSIGGHFNWLDSWKNVKIESVLDRKSHVDCLTQVYFKLSDWVWIWQSL